MYRQELHKITFKLVTLFCVCGVASLFSQATSDKVRKAVVAGQFYPAERQTLQQILQDYLKHADKVQVDGKIYGLMVPHAGYVYSGPTAALGYRQIADQNYDVVVVMAPSHRDRFRGATIFPGQAYQTPLGDLTIDHDIAKAFIQACDEIQYSELGHREEHALEVQLPFIQTVLPKAKIVPVVVGAYDWNICQKIGKAMARVLQNRRALIIASTDMYHGHSYSELEKSDQQTLDAIEEGNPEKLCRGFLSGQYQACGGGPVVILQVALQDLAQARILSHTSSGDVTGRKTGYVVGYGTVLFYAGAAVGQRVEFTPLPTVVQKELLTMARKSIVEYLSSKTIPHFEPTYDVLKESRGVFVTLTENGQLRGCIGHHESDKPLYQLVPQMAVAAAFQDPRFLPLQSSELKKIKIKVSVYLTNVYRIASLDEFKMGVHGIILTKKGRAATYLPEVPLEAGWKTIAEEMQSLCTKAGLQKDDWREGAEFWVYRTQVFDESIL